jgi:hypothetical protein
MFIPDVINTLLMGLIFMVVIVTVVRPFVLSMVSDAMPAQDMHKAAMAEIERELMRKAELQESARANKIQYQRLLLDLPAKPEPKAVTAPDAQADSATPSEMAMGDAAAPASDLGAANAAAHSAHDAVGALDVAQAAQDTEGDALAEGEIEIREGESLAEIKERIRKEQQKAKKPTIPPELLNSANSYEDKVGIVRMVVQSDQARVASAIRGMIQVK